MFIWLGDFLELKPSPLGLRQLLAKLRFGSSNKPSAAKAFGSHFKRQPFNHSHPKSKPTAERKQFLNALIYSVKFDGHVLFSKVLFEGMSITRFATTGTQLNLVVICQK